MYVLAGQSKERRKAGTYDAGESQHHCCVADDNDRKQQQHQQQQ